MMIGFDIHASDFIGMLYGLVSFGTLACLWRWANPWR